MNTPPKQPPRVWIDLTFLREGHGSCWASTSCQDGDIEYLSLSEHEALLREERAKVWEKAGNIAVVQMANANDKFAFYDKIVEIFDRNAKQERERERE